MSGSQTPSMKFDASGWRVAVVAARFNSVLVDQLIEGATRAWLEHGGREAHLVVQRVPGAFELPLAAQTIRGQRRVPRGDRAGLRDSWRHAALRLRGGRVRAWTHACRAATGVPVIFGVLTTESQAQAEERAVADSHEQRT